MASASLGFTVDRPVVIMSMSMVPVRGSVAAFWVATSMSRIASTTSLRSTTVDHRMRANAWEERGGRESSNHARKKGNVSVSGTSKLEQISRVYASRIATANLAHTAHAIKKCCASAIKKCCASEARGPTSLSRMRDSSWRGVAVMVLAELPMRRMRR